MEEKKLFDIFGRAKAHMRKIQNAVGFCDEFCFSKGKKDDIVKASEIKREKGRGMMADENSRIAAENKRLKEENEILLKTVEQMNIILNRLLDRYMKEQKKI